jgi:hypothetical protein
MNPKNRAERIAALKTIENEAKNLAESGADALDVHAFVSGARQELVKQRPDKESYFEAAVIAKKARRGRGRKRKGRDNDDNSGRGRGRGRDDFEREREDSEDSY